MCIIYSKLQRQIVKKVLILLFLALIFLGLGAVLGANKYDFSAKSVRGEFALSRLNKPALLYFGYTNCPDVCPTTLYLLNNALDELGLDAQIIFISVDKQRDSLKACDEYAKHFRADAICVEPKNFEKVAKVYDVKYKIESKNGQISVAHSPYVYALKDTQLITVIENLAQKALKRELLKLK